MSDPNHKKLSKNPKAMEILTDCVDQGLPDKKIQQRLAQDCGYNWSLKTISRRRIALGVVRKPGQKTNVDEADSPMLDTPPHGLSNKEKAHWFRDKFKKTHLYKTIKRQFEPEEVLVYLEEYGLLCCQFEDIVISEFMQIDDFLKHRILIDRQLFLLKSIKEEISELQTWMALNPKEEGEDKEKIKSRILQQRSLDDKHRYLKGVHDRYDNLAKERERIYKSLNATRKDRVDELRGGKETFFELVAQLQHSQEERDRQGRLAELTKIAAEDIKKEFRQPVEFPDGSRDAIIMDSQTNFDEED